MDTNVIDYIESKRIEKNSKLFKYLTIATVFIAVFKIILRPDILAGEGSTIDYAISLSPILLYFLYQSKNSKHKGQFIKWTQNTIEYKSKDIENSVAIPDIQDIKINFDDITLLLKDGSTQTINIIDYTDFADRKRIKSNFEKLITTPNVNQA